MSPRSAILNEVALERDNVAAAPRRTRDAHMNPLVGCAHARVVCPNMTGPNFKFEVRPYGPESTQDEVQAIKDCIYVYKPGVVMYRELPIQSIFQLDLFHAKLNEVASTLASYALLIDLTDARPPNAAIRVRLKSLFGSQANMRTAAVFTGKNFMLNVAAKFVLSGIGLKSFTVHKTLPEALEAVGNGA
jgi:hypothetical protein